MCWKFCERYNMYLSIHVFYLCLFCYLFIMLSNWENTFRNLMGMVKYVGLYPLCPKQALIYRRRICRPNVRMLPTPLAYISWQDSKNELSFRRLNMCIYYYFFKYIFPNRVVYALTFSCINIHGGSIILRLTLPAKSVL